MTLPVRVRFAPSPTGYLHIGGVRTAIFNYLFAKHHGGTFILRIEDTDRERSTDQATTQILDSMKWLGLDFGEGPYFQSQRMGLYKEHLDRLLAANKAYRCYCSAEELEEKRKKAEAEKRTYLYDGTCRGRDPSEDPAGRPFVIRVRTPAQKLDSFEDQVMGRIPIDPAWVDDWILARTDGTPTYNFCVVVDDADMKISHVIRGNDHVANTPRQLMLYQAFGFVPPKFAHMPLTHGPDGSKLSKRREAEYRKLGISVSVQEYRNMGYLAHALVNYLARLGWSHGDQEIFSREELIEKFSLEACGKSQGVINPDKLKWLNAHYIQQTDDAALAKMLAPHLEPLGIKVDPADRRMVIIARELKKRAQTLGEMAEKARIYFNPPESYDPAAVKKVWNPTCTPLLKKAMELLSAIDLTDEPAIEGVFRKLAESEVGGKLGKVAQPIRLALMGVTESPSLFAVISILGKEQTFARLTKAIATLG